MATTPLCRNSFFSELVRTSSLAASGACSDNLLLESLSYGDVTEDTLPCSVVDSFNYTSRKPHHMRSPISNVKGAVTPLS